MDVKLEQPYMEMAERTYKTLVKYYFVKEQRLFLENYEKRSDDRDFSYLWPFSGVLSAVNALAKMTGEGEKYQKELIHVLNSLEKYRDVDVDPAAYDSYVIEQGGGSKFYDDNQWLGLDFVEAYKTLGDRHYLDMAKEMFDFSISGWSDELGGGIYWQEDHKTSKNTCSNGPAAVLAMKLFEETGQDEYMIWAKKILEWTKILWNPESGVYGDHVKIDGSIDRTTYTYNTGTVIHANALLFKATNDSIYLEEARMLAQNSLTHFTTKHPDISIHLLPPTPWFNAILFKGYLALYEVDPDKDRTFIDTMRNNIDYAWAHARDVHGLFSPDWSGKTGMDKKHQWLLDQAPMVEMYALFAKME